MPKMSKKITLKLIEADIPSQAELARICGVSPTFIGMLLRGEKASKSCMRKTSRALGITTKTLRKLIESAKAERNA